MPILTVKITTPENSEITKQVTELLLSLTSQRFPLIFD
jgi:phenylpyruvate tautomerase PptA (4-oxalocrotonate tautomerase family)